VIYASDALCRFTQYRSEEIVGVNCRFFQGPTTKQADIAAIRSAVHFGQDSNVCLLNFRKDGTPFQFFLCSLRDPASNAIKYQLGVQHEVKAIAQGRAPQNAGRVYTMGSHA